MKFFKKYIDLGMQLLTDRMPRKVAISSVVLGVTLILAAIIMPVLGSYHGDALDTNDTLKTSIASLTKSLKTAKDDHQFIIDNSQKFEDLTHGDRLIPHTRGVATAQLQKLAINRGLSTLSYSFSAAGDKSLSRDTVTGGYRVQVENVELKVGSALDTQIFDFITDLSAGFPGAAVVEGMSLDRAPDMTTEALNAVSRGQESGLVKGTIELTWRTAQAQDPDKKDASAKKGRK